MGQILCQDIFNQIIQYIHYQQRPQSLTISKHINILYTKTYLPKDKQTFSNLNDILNNETFFNILLGPNHKPFIIQQNDHTINTLHEYAYKEREILHLGNISCVICPTRLSEYTCKQNFDLPNNVLSLLITVNRPNYFNNTSFIHYPQIPNDSDNFNINQIFLDNTLTKYPNNFHFVTEFNEYCPKTHQIHIISNGVLYKATIGDEFSVKMRWLMFKKEMEQPNTIQTLKIINNYNTFTNQKK